MASSDTIIIRDGNGYWEVRYEAPVGYRLNRCFDSVTVYGTESSWYDKSENLWKDLKDCHHGASTHHNKHDGSPRTTKAFLRYLKRHPELRGAKVVLVHRVYYSIPNEDNVYTNLVANYIED